MLYIYIYIIHTYILVEVLADLSRSKQGGPKGPPLSPPSLHHSLPSPRSDVSMHLARCCIPTLNLHSKLHYTTLHYNTPHHITLDHTMPLCGATNEAFRTSDQSRAFSPPNPSPPNPTSTPEPHERAPGQVQSVHLFWSPPDHTTGHHTTGHHTTRNPFATAPLTTTPPQAHINSTTTITGPPPGLPLLDFVAN